MKDISINSILDSMTADSAYLTDMWERCIDEKRNRKGIQNIEKRYSN